MSRNPEPTARPRGAPPDSFLAIQGVATQRVAPVRDIDDPPAPAPPVDADGAIHLRLGAVFFKLLPVSTRLARVEVRNPRSKAPFAFLLYRSQIGELVAALTAVGEKLRGPTQRGRP
jgi:hypothetical protein